MRAHILTADQLRALASPARNEVFSRLCSLEQASVGELARSLGRSPESVHYHVKGLLEVGLAREAFKRAGVKKPESVYEPVSRRLRLPRQDEPEIAELSRRAVAAGVRQMLRGFLEASEAAGADRRGFQVIRANLRLKPEDAEEFFRMLNAASEFAREREVADGVRMSWTSMAFPLKPSAGKP